MRYLAIGMSVAPALHGRWWERFLRAQIVVDEAWAVSHLGGGRYDRRLLLGAGLTLYARLGARNRGRRGVRVTDRRPAVARARRGLPGTVPGTAAGSDPRAALVAAALLGATIALSLVPLTPPGVPIIAASVACLLGLRPGGDPLPADAIEAERAEAMP